MDEVLLLWHPGSERVELSLRDLETGLGLQVEVAPSDAMDAFHHPYAYAARSENSHHLVLAETMVVNA